MKTITTIKKIITLISLGLVLSTANADFQAGFDAYKNGYSRAGDVLKKYELWKY